MIIQRILYPSSATLEEDLYVRRNRSGVTLCGEESIIKTDHCYDIIKFDTYFNCFSYKKWKKYTCIENISLMLNLSGKVRVILSTLNHIGFDIEEEFVYSEIVESFDKAEFKFKYPANMDAELLTFHIQPLSDKVSIYGGAYISEINKEIVLPEINLSIAICSYKREEYVKNNMELLQKMVFENENSCLKNHLRVYICDNGKSIDPNEFNKDYIKVVPNKNSGGSGGFSRGAIMAIEDHDYIPTHIILMDDDIQFDASALERTYTFLQLIKEKYKVNMLGGAMFRTDKRNIQHAAGETHTINGIIFNKAGYNMYNLIDVIRNEEEENINYLGWWFCCIPVGLFESCKYSLPLFVQYDDIEFSLRNGNIPKITLNGICCWHIPFDKKWSGFKNYYTIRNRSIVNCMYFSDFKKGRFKKEIVKECIKKIFQYSYNEAKLVLLAAEHFLNGMEWLIQQNPEELNKEVMSMSDKLLPVNQLDMRFDIRDVVSRFDFVPQKWKKIIRIITLEGWLLPANRERIIEVDNPPLQHLYRAKKVLKYDRITGRGIVVKKDYHEAVVIIAKLVHICAKIDRQFDGVVEEYKRMHDLIITEDFWRSYLNF